MKKPPKYLSIIGLGTMMILAAFLLPQIASAAGALLLQQSTDTTEGTNTPAMTTTQNIYVIGQGNLVGTLSTAVQQAYFKVHAVMPGGTYVGVEIDGYSDATYSTLTDAMSYTATPALWGSSVNGLVYANSNSCIVGDCVFTPDTWVKVTYITNLTANLAWYGVPASVSPFSLISTDYAGVTPFLQIYGVNQSLDPNLINGGNPSGISTSTVRAFCNGTYATSTGFFSDIANGVTYGACTAFAFLFVPNQDTLSQFSNLSSTTQSKIPFSYYYDFSGVLNGSTATSTSNFSALSVDLRGTGVGSTTVWASVLPSSFSYLSSTTISTYVSPTMYSLLFLLMRSAIWIAVLFHIYYRLVPKHTTHV